MLLNKLKKSPALKLIALLLAASFVVFTTGACSDEGFIISGRMPGILSPGGLTPGEQEPGEPEPGRHEDIKTPVAEHYNIENLNQLSNYIIPVTITPNSDDRSQGKITIYYKGLKDLPQTVGTYAVTFDVEADYDRNWNPASGLEAGDLIIGDPTKQTPVAGDYNISTNLTQTAGSVTAVTVTAKSGKSSGTVTVHYAGIDDTTYAKSITLPSQPGIYEVTFDVAAADGWNPASTLDAGKLTIKGTPVAADFNISANLNQTAGSVSAITITPKAGKSKGAVTVKYSNSTTLPSAAGTYTVTFDVAEAPPVWNAATGLAAGTLAITAPVVETETNYGTSLSWGTSFTPTTLGLTPGNTTAEVRVTWYRGSSTGTTPKVRFIRGTLIAGKQLIEVPGTAAGSSTTAQHKAVVTGLMPGESYVYAVSNDGNNWSPMYNFKVPAATGPFKFAVIADPQLTTGNVDSDSRYPATNVTTAAGWKETMDIISTKGVNLIVSAGDQVDTAGTEAHYTNLFAPDGIKSLPFAPVIGNHDTAVQFFQHFNIPNEQGTANSTSAGANYYYLYNNILFVGLNTGGSSPTSKSAATPLINNYKTYIQNAKKAHPNYDWLIVHHHKSTASVADHCADTDIQYYVEGGFETLMSDEKVDFVLAGHDHVYARSYPLQGLKDGQVSVPDKSAGSTNTYTNPGKPIYLTFTTGSGLKYYAVAGDPYFKYANTLYAKSNASYPYLGDVTGAGTGSTAKGSTSYMTGNYRVVSNAVFVQPYIPSYTIVEVNGKTIKFSTYPIATKSGQNSGAAQTYSFNKDVAYDWVQVTKN